MTVNEAIAMTSKCADSYIGYHEEENNGNVFARDPEVITAYGGNMDHLSWCDIFYDFLFCHLFGSKKAKLMTYQTEDMSAACKRSADNYKRNGAWFSTPQEGDQAFFYASGDINHTGYVRSVNGNEFATVEGNYSDRVAPRIYTIGDSFVAGFGRPNWSIVEDQPDDSTEPEIQNEPAEETDGGIIGELFNKIFKRRKATETETSKFGFLCVEPGDGMGAPLLRVKAVQVLLNLHGYGPMLEEDGEYGTMTRVAVDTFKKKRGLEDNSVIDELAWEQLIKFEVPNE